MVKIGLNSIENRDAGDEMNEVNSTEDFRRVMGRVTRHEFIGRVTELDRVIAQASDNKNGRGLLLLMEPAAGVSELLRQTYDQLFNRHTKVIPIYFAFTRHETTAVSAAIEFLNSFLQQYIAFRRNEPELCQTSLTLSDIVALAPSSDLHWLDQLVQLYGTLRFSNDSKELIRFCLSAPQRVPVHVGRTLVMLDGAELAEDLTGDVGLGIEVLRVFGRSGLSFVVAGLRRQILDAAHKAKSNFEVLDILRLEQLSTDQANLLIEHVARRQQVPTSRETRELMVQQFDGSPFFISHFLQAAREKNLALVSYLDCERLYADELMGGHIHYHFQSLLEDMAPQLETRLSLIRLLWEGVATDEKSAAAEAWQKRLRLDETSFEYLMHKLHIHEFVNWTGPVIDTTTGSQTWKDFLKVSYRLTVRNEPRALVVADSITDALKRAPNTMSRHYKRLGQVGLGEVLIQFDCQRVPRVLFDYESFAKKYKGENDADLAAGIAFEIELIKLPQVVHVASSLAFNSDFRQVTAEEKCVVVHGFEDGVYNDAQEVVWLVARIDSKLEVDTDIAELWYDRLDSLGRVYGFRRYQIWLISTEGFSEEACKWLSARKVFCSGDLQLELLVDQVGITGPTSAEELETTDEFLMVVPMGEDNELLAATTVEHVARRLSFQPAAINQIKTAIVEACINASEHSFSPDRKIYQRFRVENDKLVITISSRGIVPTNVVGGNARESNNESDETADERRGWGLKLIRTLMDEVEFERVDEGTSLRMTKYLRNGEPDNHIS
jgi:serine/threonine-protein kinase RsbW